MTTFFEYTGKVKIQSLPQSNAYCTPFPNSNAENESSLFSFEFDNNIGPKNIIADREEVTIRLTSFQVKDVAYCSVGTAFRIDSGKCVISFGGLLGNFTTDSVEELDKVYLSLIKS